MGDYRYIVTRTVPSLRMMRVDVDGREQWRRGFKLSVALRDRQKVVEHLEQYHRPVSDAAVDAYIAQKKCHQIVHRVRSHRPQTLRARLWRMILGG